MWHLSPILSTRFIWFNYNNYIWCIFIIVAYCNFIWCNFKYMCSHTPIRSPHPLSWHTGKKRSGIVKICESWLRGWLFHFLIRCYNHPHSWQTLFSLLYQHGGSKLAKMKWLTFYPRTYLLNLEHFLQGMGMKMKKQCTLVSFLVVWQNEQSWRRKLKYNLSDFLLVLFMSQIMQRWAWNEKVFLLMHFHFQIWHYKLNFGYYLLGHLLKM